MLFWVEGGIWDLWLKSWRCGESPPFIHFTKLTGTIGLCLFLRCLINSRVCLLLETIGSVFRQDFISWHATWQHQTWYSYFYRKLPVYFLMMGDLKAVSWQLMTQLSTDVSIWISVCSHQADRTMEWNMIYYPLTGPRHEPRPADTSQDKMVIWPFRPLPFNLGSIMIKTSDLEIKQKLDQRSKMTKPS